MKKNFKTITDIVYKDLFRVKSQESILIVFDKNTKKIAEEFLEGSLGYAHHALCIEIPIGKNHGQEPPKQIAKIMLKYDVQLLITTKSLSHTNARKKASQKGARIITMPGISYESCIRCIPIDYNKLNKQHQKLKSYLIKAKKIRITTQIGTDLSFKIYNPKIHSVINFSKKGEFHNLPEGEVFVSPIEGTANGRYIVDASQSGVGKCIKPIYIRVKDGIVTKITGYKEAKKLADILAAVKNKNAYNIAEFGIGSNPNAIITGNILEDEKVKGTCHIALGNNYSFGGKINVPLHLDGIITKPTIYCDNKIIIKEGKWIF